VIELAYADTSAGPWLIFYGPDECVSDFGLLKRCFGRLRDGAGEIVLSELQFVNAVDSVRLVATCSARGTGVKRTDRNALEFLWSQCADGWDDAVSLMAGLTVKGHQYLSRNLGDDATVVVSLGEYEPGRFSSYR
jgi:hypothetical protein